MKANELKIGNYVDYDGIATVLEIEEYAISYNSKNSYGSVGLGLINPVPLTEEWLLKFGFKEKDKKQNRFIEDNEDFEIEIQGKNYAYCIWSEECPSTTHFIGHCKHVHQLQNLYVALTGEELKIKELVND